MKQTKWFDRRFDFTKEENIFPSVVERLRGTPARLEEKVRTIGEDVLRLKSNAAWSVKENIGHLIDLEPLWIGRLEDIINGEEYLRATDLQNTKTNEAGHNETSIDVLLKVFRDTRQKTIERLARITEPQVFQSALHPRLKTPMRVMDHFLFVAEHDDHHLVAIENIISNTYE